MKKSVWAFLITLALIVIPITVLPHGGGLDSYGGHFNRKTGEYHFHRDPGWNGPVTRRADGFVPQPRDSNQVILPVIRVKTPPATVRVGSKTIHGTTINGHTYVPLREIAKALGYTVHAEGDTISVFK